MKPYIIVLFVFFTHSIGLSQNVTITGNIKDQAGNAVAYAHIILRDINDAGNLFGSLTNEHGVFEIEIPKIQYNFEISIIGLKPTVTELDLRNAGIKEDVGEIIIDVSVNLEEVVVTAHTSTYKIELDKKVYAVTKDIANNGGSLVDVMENVPSVQVEVDGNISIRGNGNVRILIDGKISGLTNTAALLKTIPAGSIDKIEVITNPSSKYGSEGSGGIINVVLKKGKKKILSSSIEVFSGIRLNSGTNINFNTGKDDSQFELGFRNRNTNIKNNFSVERINDNTSTLIPEFTDQTTYKENVIAFYSQYAKGYKKFKFQVGLRTETTSIDILSNNNTERTSKNYTNVFPSSFFDYQFNDNNSLRLSLSRRIQRPRRNTITPFNSFSDSRNVFAGNPKINPSYVVLAELGYRTKISDILSITPTVFFRNTKDVIHYFVQQQEIIFNSISQEVFVTRTVNIGDNNSLGIEISTSYKPFSWMKIYNELTITNFKQTGSFNGINYNSKGVFIYGRLNMNFAVSKSIKFQMQHRSANGRKRGQIESNGIYRMNLGLSKALFKDNASLTLNMKDIFDTWEWHIQKQGGVTLHKIHPL